MFTFQDLTAELTPAYYKTITLSQAVDLMELVNETLETLEDEGHEYEYWEVVKEVMTDYLDKVVGPLK